MRAICVSGVVMLFCLFSCRTETLQCEPAGLKVYFVGFTYGELDKAMVFVYKKDNVFDSLIDSVFSPGQQQGTSDTLMLPRTLDDDHDYRVKLSGSNTVYSITGLTLGNHYTDKYQAGAVNDLVLRGCLNNTISYTLNGQQFGQPNVMSGVYNVVYIDK
jgi:hypothetical protein